MNQIEKEIAKVIGDTISKHFKNPIKTMITPKEFAERLNGRKYGREINYLEEKKAEENNLVVVFNYNDYNIEFRGSINERIYISNKYFITKDKSILLVENSYKSNPNIIKVIWDNSKWIFKTEIPHATFNIMEDDELYCVGIVFSLDDLKE